MAAFVNQYADTSAVHSRLLQGKGAYVTHRKVTYAAGARFIDKPLHLGNLVTALLLPSDQVAHIIADIAIAGPSQPALPPIASWDRAKRYSWLLLTSLLASVLPYFGKACKIHCGSDRSFQMQRATQSRALNLCNFNFGNSLSYVELLR